MEGNMRHARFVALGLAALLGSCSQRVPLGDDTATDTGSGSDTATATDTGSDTGSDTGGDLDTDSDADTDADSDADTDADSDADSDSDTGIDAGIDAGADAGSDAGADAAVDAGPDAGDTDTWTEHCAEHGGTCYVPHWATCPAQTEPYGTDQYDCGSGVCCVAASKDDSCNQTGYTTCFLGAGCGACWLPYGKPDGGPPDGGPALSCPAGRTCCANVCD
jgi:hypothetical protein